TERTCYDLKGLPLRKSIYEYELDSAGNWVKRMEDFKETREGKPPFFVKTVLYRTITYASSETDFSAKNPSLPEQLSPLPPSPMVIRKSSGVLSESATKRVEPVYPKEALAAGVKGSVVVEVTISEKGKVEKVVVISGPNELHETTINAVKQWEFKPTSL